MVCAAFRDCPGGWRAVANNEINFNRLKARKKAVISNEFNSKILEARKAGNRSSLVYAEFVDCPDGFAGSR